ncbi:MAG: GNAT family N-acetyltransferase [Mariniblastus sp.]|nr:GNAT family N-acetyltransferase [Mariniblastus sp.]
MNSDLRDGEIIRPMTSKEVQKLVEWAGEEGWNPGINDAESFWNLDPDGFLAIANQDELIGGGAIIKHGNEFGFMGLFIVSQPHRGKGRGMKLWFTRRDRLLSRLNNEGTIGLDGVDQMVPFYEKGGFTPFTRHRRFQLKQPALELIQSEQVVEIGSVSKSALADYDRQCFPVRREQFLQDWTTQANVESFGFVSDGRLLGFGVMRPCLIGWKIGPLFADSIEIADALFQSFQLASKGMPIFLDVPDNNSAATDLCMKYKMLEVFGCVRMYYGPAPVLDHQRIFGITTLEIG